MRHIGGVLAAAVLAALAWAPLARAEAGLQLVPLKYEDTLSGTQIKTGFIDVSNPSDTTVTVVTDVQGFRQADLDGNLAFFADDALKAGIVPDLKQFSLGPRESIRVMFQVNPVKLPRGGVYAALFFRTIPPAVKSNVSYIAEAANVGTLLMLQNGGTTEKVGEIIELKLPFWQFGRGLAGQVQYRNTNRNVGGAAFNPELESQVLPWGRQVKGLGPFIMPQTTRQFSFNRPGAYAGLLPVTVTDTTSGKHVTRWVLACTGWYQLAGLLVALLVLVWLMRRWLHRGLVALIRRRLR